MKKKFFVILIILSFFTVDATIGYYKEQKKIKEDSQDEIRAIYISYLEYLNNFYGHSKSFNEKKIDEMIDNVLNMGFNVIILHVSPFSDSIYPSQIFPYSYTLTGEEGRNPGFDYLAYFLTKAHQKNLYLYAWINPYRVSFDNNLEKISQDNPVYKLINTSNIKMDKKGIYYNPASEIVKNLILRQIEEIIDHYDVDGIHFDDYFYLQDDIDKLEYHNYLRGGGDLSLRDFRLYHTNDLIKRVYTLIKKKNPHILFSIAPDGNINNNYLYHYADVKTWLKEGYVDIIMPQIYYGFYNEYEPFIDNLTKWEKLKVNDNVQIVPILAFYKCGFPDEGAGTGKNEWVNSDDIIKRQIVLLRNRNLLGYGLFRYDYLFDSDLLNERSVKESENLQKINKKYG